MDADLLQHRRYVAGYGDDAAKPLSQAEADIANADMDNVVNALRRAVLSVRARVAVESNFELLAALAGPMGIAASTFTSSSDAKAAVLSAMATMSSIIDRLDGPSRRDVLAGTEAPEKWLAGAEPVADGVKAQLKLLNDEASINLISAQLDQATSDFKTLSTSVATNWPLWIGLGVGGLLLVWLLPTIVGAFIMKPRHLAGYHGKKRRGKKRRFGWADPETKQLEGRRS